MPPSDIEEPKPVPWGEPIFLGPLTGTEAAAEIDPEFGPEFGPEFHHEPGFDFDPNLSPDFGVDFRPKPGFDFGPDSGHELDSEPGLGSFGPQFTGPSFYGAFMNEPPQFYVPPPAYSSYGLPLLGSFPHTEFTIQPSFHTGCTEPNALMPVPQPLFEFGEHQEDETGACYIAHRKYMEWISTTYYSPRSPVEFVSAWRHAYKEMKQAFGRPQLPMVFVLNQFLTAVSVNPNVIPWVQSLDFEIGSLPSSILDEACADFVGFETQRLGEQIALGYLGTAVPGVYPPQLGDMQFCPFHQRHTLHPLEECFLNPRNKRRKRRWRRKQARISAAHMAQ
jgi:hypothetical protein